MASCQAKASTLRGHTAPVLALATGPLTSRDKDFTNPRSLLLSGSEDSTVRLWDLNSNKPVRCMMGCFEKNPINSVCFTPGNPNLIFAAAGKAVYGFDLRKESVVLMKADKEFKYNSDDINQIQVNRKGKLLAACDDSGGINIIDIGTSEGKVVRELQDQEKSICMSVQFRPRSAWELASASLGLQDAIVQWDISKGRALRKYQNAFEKSKKDGDEKQKQQVVNPPFANSISFSRDGHTVAAGLGNGSVALYNFKSKRGGEAILGSLEGHSSSVCQVEFPAFGDTRDLVSCGNDQTVVLWKLHAENKKDDNGSLGSAKARIALPEKPNWITTTSFNSACICVADCSTVIKVMTIR
eukprot:jgi/Bigna1/70352/fgenesh1_pg.11_\